MLFRQRVSFQGALHVRRRACDEMAAYNAPTNMHHETQRYEPRSIVLNLYQQRYSIRWLGSLGFTAPLPSVNPTHQSAFPPTQASSRTIDCRWKRGRPVTFSDRAFSTKQADLNAQADAVTVGPVAPGSAGQPHEHREVVTPLCQSRQHSEGSGNAATVKQQGKCAESLPRNVQPDRIAPVQTDRAFKRRVSSEENSTASATSSSPADTRGTRIDDQDGTTSKAELDMELASLKGSTMDGATDTDYLPSSTDESGSQSEEDGPEAGDAEEEATETHIPLEFQIPEHVLRTAMAAPENTKASFWSSNLYRGPEGEKILVHYCKTKEVAERVAQHFVKEQIVGFDIEWKPYAHPASVKKNVSLIQLACDDRIALFHVALFAGKTAAQLMPPTLKAILESPEVYKVGVAVKGDFSRIVKYLQVEPQGVFELSRLHNLVQFSATDPSKVTNKLVGLAAQVQQHLQLPLYKGGHLVDDPEDTSNVRSSDWSLPLNPQQIHYAAADAYAGFRLYDVLEEKRKQLKPTPSRPLPCDYDSKPKPKSSDSKPRKKRTAVTKTDEAASAVAEESSAPVEQEEEEREEEMEKKSKQSQDTEGYETAQEDLLNSHELEGDDPASSEESYKATEESDDHDSIDSAPSLRNEETAAATGTNQRRVGRINLSWLKGPDPDYPTLPELCGGEDPYTSSDEDLIDISERSEEEKLDQSNNLAGTPEENEETDEFDDSELEEALDGLNIDSDGRLQEATKNTVRIEPIAPPEHPGFSVKVIDVSEQTQAFSEREIENDKPIEAGPPASITNNSISDKEEQRLIDLLNDPEVIGYLHTRAQPTASPSAPIPPLSAEPTTQPTEQSTHAPQYDLATSWAQSYLASTIPSPTSRTPSHIRATIPHLRAYNMWHHQGLSLTEIARQLRDPPLSESTVGSYVLQAITLEKMEYDKEEVRKVLMGMPEALKRGKWRGLAEKVGAK